tara:strand:- start:4361 stop:4780 length:420 start_codon:yes stop_codon:yes gene_type:complete
MNVRISYSTELKDVPLRIIEMLAVPDKHLMENSRKLDLITDLLQESDGKYSPAALEMLDELRKALSEIDQDLLECQQILEGYIQAVAPPAPPMENQAKSLSSVPRGKEAVKYVEDTIDDPFAALNEATGELPILEENDV